MQRLVREYLQSREDERFLEEAPPAYLVELFVIILSYLTILWKDGLVEDTFFAENAMALLTGFWGKPDEPGLWSLISDTLTEEDRQALLRKWNTCQRTWFVAFLLARLWEGDSTRIYQLAAWMRYFNRLVGAPETLQRLPAAEWERLWEFNAPSSWESLPPDEVIDILNATLPQYDEKSLIAELNSWPNTRAERKIVKTYKDPRVPSLEVQLPLTSQEDAERCLDAFLTFLNWPQPKKAARMICYNTNPPSHPDDIISLRFIFTDQEFIAAKETAASDGPIFFDERLPVTPAELAALRAEGKLSLPSLFATS